MFRIKEKSDGNYFMSIVISRHDLNYKIYCEVINFQISNNFDSNSWINLTSQTNDEKEYHYIIGENPDIDQNLIYIIKLQF